MKFIRILSTHFLSLWHHLNFDTFFIRFIALDIANCSENTSDIIDKVIYTKNYNNNDLFFLFRRISNIKWEHGILAHKILLWSFHEIYKEKTNKVWDWHFEYEQSNSKVISIDHIVLNVSEISLGRLQNEQARHREGPLCRSLAS